MRLCARASLLTAALLLGPAAHAGDPDSIPVASLPATVAVPDMPTAVPARATAVAAAAPAFTSVSSLPTPTPAPTPAPAPAASAPAAPVPAAPANALPVAAPAPAAVLAFSSVSSLGAGPNATGSGPTLPAATSRSLMADRILIEKGKRRLQLLSRGQVIAEYPVKLGLTPRGHKQHEGDFRTPEGVYHLSRRNPRSEFFLSVEVSYPNEADRARAKAEGLRPGGLIMIHGQPNVPRRPPEYYANNDWTDGCIAVSNDGMRDIWRRTRLGIPIEIRP
jgi:hypothetical protein